VRQGAKPIAHEIDGSPEPTRVEQAAGRSQGPCDHQQQSHAGPSDGTPSLPQRLQALRPKERHDDRHGQEHGEHLRTGGQRQAEYRRGEAQALWPTRRLAISSQDERQSAKPHRYDRAIGRSAGVHPGRRQRQEDRHRQGCMPPKPLAGAIGKQHDCGTHQGAEQAHREYAMGSTRRQQLHIQQQRSISLHRGYLPSRRLSSGCRRRQLLRQQRMLAQGRQADGKGHQS